MLLFPLFVVLTAVLALLDDVRDPLLETLLDELDGDLDPPYTELCLSYLGLLLNA